MALTGKLSKEAELSQHQDARTYLLLVPGSRRAKNLIGFAPFYQRQLVNQDVIVFDKLPQLGVEFVDKLCISAHCFTGFCDAKLCNDRILLPRRSPAGWRHPGSSRRCPPNLDLVRRKGTGGIGGQCRSTAEDAVVVVVSSLLPERYPFRRWPRAFPGSCVQRAPGMFRPPLAAWPCFQQAKGCLSELVADTAEFVVDLAGQEAHTSNGP